MAVDVTGDDGTTKIDDDGNTPTIYGVNPNKYASLPVSGELNAMFKVATGRLAVDFPLADFLVDAPDKAFLTAPYRPPA